MKAKEDLGVGCLDDVPGEWRSSNAGEGFKGSSAGVTTWLNLEDIRSSAASPGELLVGACEDTLRGVDGQLREGDSGRGSEDNNVSHHVDCDLCG